MYTLNGFFQKAIVTGGAGFVGSNLVESLLNDGLQVVSIDDFSAGKRENLRELESKFKEKLTIVECDITDPNKLKKYFSGVDIVFHQACSKMTVCLKDPIRDLEVNAAGTFNLLKLSVENSVKKFIHVSTGSVYGEAQYYPTDEKHPVNPSSYYGVSKLAGEKYARAFTELHGLDVSILRYFHVYGPKQDHSEVGGVIGIFSEKALTGENITIHGTGEQIRSFTHVKDVVNINKLIALKGAIGEAYNCASGLKVSIKELADKIIALAGSSSIIEFSDWKVGDIKHFDVGNEKLKKLGFNFAYDDFDVGLEETFKWYKKKLTAEK
ncbi:SDR family NAD(P)-dependent oxidoreductase [Pseudidiomarina sp. 1APR75-33.1]|uniref:SDR family NAD(P)-dependent oxidoreductase n=1 Tax=Pseudidiomarina terrestris TaxID=2820060 RepID=UPI00265319AB|nr:SDR family NAD(P)-dependent oxidoreductase [Pseudidiomarina sp. 1APR75-33.1]MDN7126943.1 SDR family NAD(P)-dependent oxidoreductase [Pseudidiomarina sp. 1APR75-33.1]